MAAHTIAGFRASKPWTLPASVTSVLLGTQLAWKYTKLFDLQILLVSMAIVVLTHSAGNLVNSFYDARRRPYFGRKITPSQAGSCVIFTYALAIAAFIYLTKISSTTTNQELILFISGVLGSVLFGAGLKSVAAGDIVVFSVFGPLIVLFAYVVQVAGKSTPMAGSSGVNLWQVVFYSLPLAFNTEAIIHSQNIRDIETDRRAGDTTLAVLMGRHHARVFYSFVLMVPYLIIAALCALHSYFYAIPLVTFPLALSLRLACYQGELNTLDQKTTILNFSMGLLYILAIQLS